MANYEYDIIRVEDTEANLPNTVIAGQIGFSTDSNKMLHLMQDGVTEQWFSSDESTWLYWDSSGNGGITTTVPQGHLHIYSGDAGVISPLSSADDFVISNNGDCGISIFGRDEDTSSIYFGSPSDSSGGALQWNHDDNNFLISTNKANSSMKFYTGSTQLALTINSSGDFIFPWLSNNAVAFIGGGSTPGYLKTTTDLTYDESNGRLGINTDTPLQSFEVIGNSLIKGHRYHSADSQKDYFGASNNASITYATHMLFNSRESGSGNFEFQNGNVGILTTPTGDALTINGVTVIKAGTLTVNGTTTITGNINNSVLTASRMVSTDSSKNLISLAPISTYTITNVTTDRTYDANSTTTDELADVLGTLISDLQSANILS